MYRKALLLLGVIVLALLLAMPTMAQGNITRPQDGECPNGLIGTKLDFNPAVGEYTLLDGGYKIWITANDADGLDWTSNFGVDAVVMKGGPSANIYYYDEATEGFNLTPPINASNGSPYGISHVTFCYDFEVSVSKTVNPTFTRTYKWDIEKSVDDPLVQLLQGGSQWVKYTIVVNPNGFADSDWAVDGTITIFNPAPIPATVTGVSDVINGVVNATVICPQYPFNVPANSSVNCTYSAGLGDGAGGTNVATVTTSGAVLGNNTGPVPFAFGAPTTEKDKTYTVSDSMMPNVNAPGVYDYLYTCGKNGRTVNVASVYGGDTGLLNDSDDAIVDLECYSPSVSKTANTSYVRTFHWTIEKSVTPEHLDLFVGDSADVQYTVKVTKTGYTDTDYRLFGNIKITNPAPFPVNVSVVDSVSGNVIPTNCPAVVNPGDTTCSYNVAWTNQGGLNEVTVNWGTGSAYNSAPFAFGAPSTLVYDKINVDDSNGMTWEFGDTGEVKYPKTFRCGTDHSHKNIATIRETSQFDDANVTVDCHELNIEKTGSAYYTREWDWTITKTGSTSAIEIPAGDNTFPVSYEVIIGATYTEYGFGVKGTVKVDNFTPLDADLASVTDTLGDLDCGVIFPYTLLKGQSLVCTYDLTTTDKSKVTNEAVAKLTAELGGGEVKDTVEIVFGDPTEVIDESVNVIDDQFGNLGSVDAPGKKFTYTLNVGPYAECGEYQFVNKATFTTNDTQSTGEATWTVDVTVPCDGCTLTQGYWKTHSSAGPAPYDSAWGAVGDYDKDLLFEEHNEAFLKSGKTWLGVFQTAPQGNAYYNLAHQYMAAYLNIANGAYAPPEVVTAMNTAYNLMKGVTPTGKFKSADFTKTAAILDKYNNGLIGPGHCSE